ncbi:MAG: hypothetical protein ACO1NS_01510 [Daejeonella sp.]|uniref:hypothetical protein n=1 Tax=Daejeonella sp. JGW-45 TaxID=3034148 RepID=UPI0023EACB89|nr:hypothetical protein [Daejeonella sp. JGW-45]
MTKKAAALLLFLSIVFTLQAQHTSDIPNLYKRISLDIVQQPVGEVLEQISKKGGFYFSYSGNAFNRDSLISIAVKNQPVRDILDRIFLGKVDYRESSRYIILRSTLLHFAIEPETIKTDSKHYLITGKVVDVHTGKNVADASVYEKRLLESTLTNKEGYFRMRIRGEFQSVILTVSKEAYRDTSIMFLSTVTIKPEGYVYSDEDNSSYVSNIVERLGIGRFLVSAKQQIQSLNLAGFMARSPFQASLLPGLSSHGMFSPQVVNKASLNVFGGYTAGVNGVEVAGLFNINKGDVRHFQAAGLTNLVGGSVHGFQAGGVLNSVLDSVHGFQAAGVVNDVRMNMDGWQAAGVLNHVRKNLKGVQVSGVANLVSNNSGGIQVSGIANLAKSAKGIQISGIGNVARQEMRGLQLAGIFNYAKKMNGVQLGLINVADSSSGVSIGLINWVNKGYHKVSLSANDVFNYQLGIKTGNARLYSILIASATFKEGEKVYSAGLGFGHDFIFNNTLSAAAEISSQGLYLGNFDSANILSKAQLNVQVKVMKGISLFAGPAYNVYHTDPAVSSASGFKNRIGPLRSGVNRSARGWMGWNAGITLL